MLLTQLLYERGRGRRNTILCSNKFLTNWSGGFAGFDCRIPIEILQDALYLSDSHLDYWLREDLVQVMRGLIQKRRDQTQMLVDCPDSRIKGSVFPGQIRCHTQLHRVHRWPGRISSEILKIEQHSLQHCL